MRSNGQSTNRALKQKGKIGMSRCMNLWMGMAALLIGVQLVLTVLSARLGGALGWYLIPIDTFQDAVTGFFRTKEGFELVFRLDAMQMVAAISLAWWQIWRFVLINAVVLILLSPLRAALMERLWLLFRGKKSNFPSPLRWVTRPGLLGKSVLISFCLRLGGGLVTLILMLPSMLLYLYLYSGDLLTDVARMPQASLLAILGTALVIGGGLLAFYLCSLLAPLAYCLAAQPEYSLGKIFRRGLESIRGSQRAFFSLRLSFLPWMLISRLTSGMMELFLLPYLSFTSFQFLHERALRKDGSGESLQTSAEEAGKQSWQAE